MRTTFFALVFGILAAACGAAGDTQKPLEAPPPPPAGPAPLAEAAAPPPTQAAAPAKPSMQEMQKALVGAIADAISGHDPAKSASSYADDATVLLAGMPDAIKGKDAIFNDAKKFVDAVPNAKFGFARAWGKNELLVTEWVVTGTHLGEFMGLKATEKPVGYSGLSFIWVNPDGKIKEEHRYFDVATILAQVGMAPKGVKARPLPQLPSSVEWHFSKGEASEDKSVDATKALYAATEKKDEKAFGDVVADDIAWDDVMAPAPTKGKADMVKGLKLFTAAFPDLKMTTTNAAGVEDFALVEYTMTGTNKAPFMGLPVTKKPVTLHGTDVVEVKDGKVAKGWSYLNGAELLVQVGAMKQPGVPPPKAAPAPKKK